MTDPIHEASRALFALRLEVDGSIVDDVKRRMDAALAAAEEKARCAGLREAAEIVRAWLPDGMPIDASAVSTRRMLANAIEARAAEGEPADGE